MFQSYFIWMSGKQTLKTVPTTSDHNIVRTITLLDHGTITDIAVFDQHSQPQERGNILRFIIPYY